MDMDMDTVGDYCNLIHTVFHLSNGTVTAITNHTKNLWKSPRGTVIRIEFLVSVAVFLLLVLAIFGTYRRRSKSWLLQMGVLGAYTLSPSLVTYTLGSMQSSAVKSSMYSIWAISLFLLHGCADGITAYSLDDNKEINRQLYQGMLFYAYGLFLLLSDPNGILEHNSWGSELVYYLLVISVIKFGQRMRAYRLASKSWKLNKVVADYMYGEHERTRVYNPATMEGYHYLVDWPLSKSKMAHVTYLTEISADPNEIISIQKIWFCRSLGPELKDECLSFSLFQLLRRRVFGFACGESRKKARDLVFNGLLSDPENNYSRVFKVIDVELALMYDFFFTKYAAIYYESTLATMWSLASATIIALTVHSVATRDWVYKCSRTKDLSCVFTNKADVVTTIVILVSAALLELVQMLLFWSSVWGRVSLVCQHIRGSCCLKTLKGLLARIGVYFGSNKHYWQHKLGQYSLLESVSHRRNILAPLLIVLDCIYTSSIRRRHGKPIELSAQVKGALVRSLVRTGGVLTNGKSSLESNEADSLSWACVQKVHPETSCIILTWHIATCYCEMAAALGTGAQGEAVAQNFGVATRLSRYCAYLVVSEPKLLPGHHCDTERVFDAAADEAIQFLQSAEDMYETMRDSNMHAHMRDSGMAPPTVFKRGVVLGKKLEEMPEDTRWKVMADFWAERRRCCFPPCLQIM